MAEPSITPISSQLETRRPRLRAGLSVARRTGETVIISPRLETMESIDDPEGVWAGLLSACDGSTGLDGVRRRLAQAGIELSPSELVEAVDLLASHGLLVDGAGDIDDEWANQRAYIEQLTRDDLDTASAQEEVRRTKVLILGAGGTGSWLALALTMMGVADMTVIDPDLVEDRNRARQPYPTAALGRRKVEVLGEMVTGLQPGLRYAGVDLRVEHVEDLSALVQDKDVVACCADEPSLDVVGSVVARACIPQRIPHLLCGYNGASGRVGPFWYHRRRPLPCHGCVVQAESDLFLSGSHTSLVTRRYPTAVSAAQAQLVGSLAAAEILHFRAGVHPASAGKLFALDSLSLGTSRSRVRLREDCPICFGGRKPRVAVTSPRTTSSVRR
jgi:molybdopterin/thiamine biosynthesis adenylyltransferase